MSIHASRSPVRSEGEPRCSPLNFRFGARDCPRGTGFYFAQSLSGKLSPLLQVRTPTWVSDK